MMRKLEFNKPILNAAGSLGFVPRHLDAPLVESFAAFVTNPISLRQRKSAHATQQLNYSGGVLLHTGWPNPGLKSCLRRFGPLWARSQLPIIVHLLADESKDVSEAVQRIEEQENIIAIELGLDTRSSSAHIAASCKAAAGELPIIAQLPIERAKELARIAIDAGASAISLGAPRGCLPGPKGELITGRLYGPGIFPQALNMVAVMHNLDIPVIGAGGIYLAEQARAMLNAGAAAIQLDSALWKGDYKFADWGNI